MVVKPGLLVEVQVSFCTVPISKGRFIMLSKLRAVCVLSRQVQEVSVKPKTKDVILTKP